MYEPLINCTITGLKLTTVHFLDSNQQGLFHVVYYQVDFRQHRTSSTETAMSFGVNFKLYFNLENLHCLVKCRSESQAQTYPLSDFVDLVVQEVEVGIKVKLSERSLADQSVRQFAFEVHYQLEHLVVGLAGEHDPTGVELVDCDRGRPEVYAMVVAHTEN